jgi:hypothetical protein
MIIFPAQLTIKSIIFRDITLRSPFTFNWRFGGTYRLIVEKAEQNRRRESRWQAELSKRIRP